MKLATLRNGQRDGQLLVVSRDLSRAVAVPHVAPTLQAALDDWSRVVSRLEQVAQDLEDGRLQGSFPFDVTQALAPLPRAFHWVDGSAYVNHVELVRRALGAEMPVSIWTDPLMYQGGSDDLLGPCDDLVCPAEDFGIDFEAEVAVIVDDVPMGTAAAAAGSHIRLLMLANDVSLRNLIPAELAKGFGFFQSKPATAFSPVAVTPDALGAAWDGHRVHLPLVVHWNGEKVGAADAGVDPPAGTRHGSIKASGDMRRRSHPTRIVERQIAELVAAARGPAVGGRQHGSACRKAHLTTECYRRTLNRRSRLGSAAGPPECIRGESLIKEPRRHWRGH